MWRTAGLFGGFPDSRLYPVDPRAVLPNHELRYLRKSVEGTLHRRSCSGIYEASMCTYDPQRRSSVSRNCYLWGCESRVSLTSFTLMDALERWYPTHAVMTPVYLDLRYSNSTLQIVVDDGHSFSIRGVDGKTILEKCFEVRCPFVCLRIHKNNIGIVKDYGFQLRGFQTTELESEDVLLFSQYDG